MIDDFHFTPAAQSSRDKYLGNNLFEDNFHPETPYNKVKFASGIAEGYGLERFDVRKARADRSRVYVAKPLHRKEITIKANAAETWTEHIAVWDSIEAIFSGEIFFAGDNQLIELINEKTGKITYVSPPDTDSKGIKFSAKKMYKVVLKKNFFSGRSRYEFVLLSPIKTTSEQNNDILKRVAESI